MRVHARIDRSAPLMGNVGAVAIAEMPASKSMRIAEGVVPDSTTLPVITHNSHLSP